VQQQTWFIVHGFRDNIGNLVHAIKLNPRDYRTLLITNGILWRRGNELVINNGALQELTERLQPDMSIHIKRARILNRNARNIFLATNEPIYHNPNPNLQLCYNHRIRRNGQQIVGLNNNIIIIRQFCDEGIPKENHHPDEVETGQAEQL
jgi:hypothetical protein